MTQLEMPSYDAYFYIGAGIIQALGKRPISRIQVQVIMLVTGATSRVTTVRDYTARFTQVTAGTTARIFTLMFTLC